MARVFAVFALRLRPDKSGLRRAKSEAFFDLRSFSVGGSEGGPGTKLVEFYECHGTNLIEVRKLSRYKQNIIESNGACPGATFSRICLGSSELQKP